MILGILRIWWIYRRDERQERLGRAALKSGKKGLEERQKRQKRKARISPIQPIINSPMARWMIGSIREIGVFFLEKSNSTERADARSPDLLNRQNPFQARLDRQAQPNCL